MFWILDGRHVWFDAAIQAAERHGHVGRRVFSGREAVGGIGFVRPDANPALLGLHQQAYAEMRCQMVQDPWQVRYYENKSAQWRAWGDWMPETWRFTDEDAALSFIEGADYPLVSKADEGSSSTNVRVLRDKAQAAKHIRDLFSAGLVTNCGSDGSKSRQQGYALLQRFIPHTTTYRVNAIGDARAIFLRYCYPDKPVAQTGNVEPAMKMTDELESLLEYANRFCRQAKTKWVALDILKDGDGWKLLETSLAWPWPSPGKCNEGPIFGSKRKWIELFDVLFDEIERGAWSELWAAEVSSSTST